MQYGRFRTFNLAIHFVDNGQKLVCGILNAIHVTEHMKTYSIDHCVQALIFDIICCVLKHGKVPKPMFSYSLKNHSHVSSDVPETVKEITSNPA